MLLVLGEVSMPGCMTCGPSATGRRRARLLRFWVLVAIGTAWTYGAPIGLPGERKSNSPKSIRCPECGKVASKQANNSYKCEDNHVSIRCPECVEAATKQVYDSYKCKNNHISILCPKCGEAASRQADDSYKCKNNHVSRKQPDGSYECDDDHRLLSPAPSASSEQNAD